MARQYEELRLTVTLVDNASAQLAKIQQTLEQIQGINRRGLTEQADGISRITKSLEDMLKKLGAADWGRGLETITKHAREMGSVFKPLGEGIEAAGTKLLPFARSAGIVAGSMVGVGLIFQQTVARIQEFSESMEKLHARSARIGVDPAQYQSMVETMRSWGLSIEQAQANIDGLASSMASLTKERSDLRISLMQGAGIERASAEAMERSIAGLSKEDLAGLANAVGHNMKIIRENMYQRQRSLGRNHEQAKARAEEVAQSYQKEFKVEGFELMLSEFGRMSEAEQKRWQARIDGAREFRRTQEEMRIARSHVDQDISSILSLFASPYIKSFFETAKNVGDAIHNILAPIEDWMTKRQKEQDEAQKKEPSTFAPKAWWRLLPGGGFLGGAGDAYDYFLRDYVRGGAGGQQTAPATGTTDKENRDYYQQQLKSYQKKPTGPGAPAGFYSSEIYVGDGGPGGGGDRSRTGLSFSERLALADKDDEYLKLGWASIDDRREGNQLTQDDIDETKENTRERKRLTDILLTPQYEKQGALAEQLGINDIPGAGDGKDGGGAGRGVGLLSPGGGVSMRGLGGLPGMGTAGPGGGGGDGGGGGGGGGGEHQSPTTSTPQTPATQAPSTGTGPVNDAAVPSNILATAQQVALKGGPAAVEKFMRDQGYPKHSAWCGDFAASVVKAAGGTPPKNPSVASNWRNYGTAVDVPQPGDIAVRKGVRTGQTGSHVTFVESVDPKTGRFVGLGGNQGRFQSSMRTSQYEFRRPPQPSQTATPQAQPAAPQTATQQPPAQHGIEELRALSEKQAAEQPSQKATDGDVAGARRWSFMQRAYGAMTETERVATGQYRIIQPDPVSQYGMQQLQEKGRILPLGSPESYKHFPDQEGVSGLSRLGSEAVGPTAAYKPGTVGTTAEMNLAHEAGHIGEGQIAREGGSRYFALRSRYGTDFGEVAQRLRDIEVLKNVPPEKRDARWQLEWSEANEQAQQYAGEDVYEYPQAAREKLAEAAKYNEELKSAAAARIDRAAVDRNGAKVETNGSLKVDVRAPQGAARVEANGTGLLKNVEVNRTMTAPPPAAAAPQAPAAVEAGPG